MEFSQIIYGSTEKSIISGRSGFGVRTTSGDLDGATAESINQAMRLNMNVPAALRPTLEQLRVNPAILSRVPHAFSFRPVDGGRYAAGRAVYIAADYGFYSGDEAFQRVGSNYIAHTLVTTAPAPRELFRLAVADGVFQPDGNDLSPANGNLVAMVAGEPVTLPPLQLDVEALRALPVPLDSRLAHIAIALVTARCNRSAGGTAPTGVLVKARSEDTAELVAALSQLPPELAVGLAVLTSYNKGGMPTDVDLIMVDETGEDIPSSDYNITVDLMQAVDADGHYPTANIAFDLLDDKLIEIAEQGDATTFERFVSMMISHRHKRLGQGQALQDEEDAMAIKMFFLTQTDRRVNLTDLAPDNIDALTAGIRSLPHNERDIAAAKVNELLNDLLADAASTPRSRLLAALTAAGHLHRHEAELLDIGSEAREAVRDLAFDSDDPQLTALVKATDPDVLLWLLNPVERVPFHRFEAAMQTVADEGVWRTMLHYHFGDTLHSATATVVPMLLRSPLKEPETVIGELFHNSTAVAEATLTAAGTDDDRTAKRVINVLASLINRWFDNDPTAARTDLLEQISAAALPLPSTAAARLSTLLAIRHGDQPDKMTARAIELAIDLGRKNGYIETMVDTYTAANPLHNEVANLVIHLMNRGDSATAARLLGDEWLHRKKGSRRDVMSTILEHVSWSDHQRRDVIAAIKTRAAGEKELDGLIECINDTNSLMSRLKRALRSLFGQK